MYRIIVIFALVSVAFAGLVPGQTRDTWVEGEVSNFQGLPGTPVPGRGADALIVFPAFSNISGIAWGSTYWNPNDEQFPATFTYDAVNPSTAIPSGTPYHWNGGLGTALDNLGVTWEWFPTWDNEDAMQTMPGVSTLQEYEVVFLFTFDNWWNSGLSDESVGILSDYMDAGGKVVFVGQDAHYGGLSGTWLNDYFACGTITDDVINGDATLAASGVTGTFLGGWSGIADQLNFSDANGFYTDALSDNGLITEGTNFFSSYNDTNKCIYSTFEFEACAPSEVEEIAALILEYVGVGGALEQSTWGGIKTIF